MEWAGCDHLVGRLEGLSALAIEWVMRSWVENELAGERVACKEPEACGAIGRGTWRCPYEGGKATGGFVRARYAGWSLHPSCLLLVMASSRVAVAASLVMRAYVAWRGVRFLPRQPEASQGG
jgi:hypothetical protein